MTKVLRVFNFSLLPSLEFQSMFVRLDQDVDEQLGSIPELVETYNRARAALMFFYQTDEKSESWRNDARLRAGLNELYSMQDSATRGFRSISKGRSAPKLSESVNPLLHLMYIMRNINVHTAPLPSIVDQITVIYSPNSLAEEMTYGAVMLDDVTMSDLLRSNEIKDYYNRSDLEKSCAWLMEKQRAFGIPEVFSRGVSAYCREILAAYEVVTSNFPIERTT